MASVVSVHLPVSVLVVLPLTLLIIWIVKRWLRSDPLSHIPLHPGIPVLGNMLQMEPTKFRLTFHKWARQYGGAYRVRMIPTGEIVIISSWDLIHEILVTKGSTFSDRFTYFRGTYTKIDRMLSVRNADDTWRLLRKLSHRYMKQFGDGMSKVEDILQVAVTRMVGDFRDTNCSPVNTMRILKQTALYSISVLLLGRAVDPQDPLLEMLIQYEHDFMQCLGFFHFQMLVLDRLPWLIHAPLQCSRDLKAFVKFQADLWRRIKENQRLSRSDSLTKLLLENVVPDRCGTSGKTDIGKSGITDTEAGLTCLNLIFAGIITTSISMHYIINVLAFRIDVQDRIRGEMLKAIAATWSDRDSLAHKSTMPYLRATILETLRQFPPAVMNVNIHKAAEDTELKGYGRVPKGTHFMINTWALHHDRDFWGDPEKFRPERSLDDRGELLPPDHPNRKRVLSFGAGPRVCLGEIFAMARLFLWTSALVKEFVITPAVGSDPDCMDPYRQTDDGIVLTPLPCNVVFTPTDPLS